MFDQPNLKATYQLIVAAPPKWRVIFNTKYVGDSDSEIQEMRDFFLNKEGEDPEVDIVADYLKS